MLGLTIRNAQVAIAGKVIQAVTKEAMAGAVVEIIKMPAKFERILQMKALQAGDQWEGMKVRGDRRISQADGSFFFTDLSVGEYTIRATIPHSSTRYKTVERTYQVTQHEAELQTATGDLAILPTGLQGKIFTQNKGVAFAKIKLIGGTESTIADQTGAYRFTGLEASGSAAIAQSLFQISSPDHSTQQQSVVLQQGVMSNIDFVLD